MNGSQKQQLQQIARAAMRQYGLEPDFSPAALSELQSIGAPPVPGGLKDLRTLPWSSIDNDDSRDLDQIEVCIEDGDHTRVLIGVADVDALVPKGSPLDDHARANTTSIYTPAVIFPMIPPELSTDKTSLNESQDRAALVVDMTIAACGDRVDASVYRALVRNQAQLAYNAVAAWLNGSGPMPERIGKVNGLEAQLRLQDRIAHSLQTCREQEGALDFDRSELKAVVQHDSISELQAETPNRAKSLIENFMVAANGAVVRFLSSKGLPSIRRVVKSPERWDRIVSLAKEHDFTLPDAPDAKSLQTFLKAQRAKSPDTFPDLSLAVIKLLGRGEYVADKAGDPSSHFALAAASYTHSTAPNRRFPDVITQRLVKAALTGAAAPYSFDELSGLAQHCTAQEDAANKVERLTKKAAAALYLQHRIGEQFDSIVTGAGAKGTWVRLLGMPVEGRLDQAPAGIDVGRHIRVRLLSTNPSKGFIDFAPAS